MGGMKYGACYDISGWESRERLLYRINFFYRVILR